MEISTARDVIRKLLETYIHAGFTGTGIKDNTILVYVESLDNQPANLLRATYPNNTIYNHLYEILDATKVIKERHKNLLQ